MVTQLLKNLSLQAINSPSSRYASGFNDSNFPKIYGLVQCWKDISMDDCQTCVYNALDVILGHSVKKGSVGGQVLSGSCVSRYETYSFFRSNASRPSTPSITPPLAPSSPPSGSGKSSSKLPIILGVVGGSILLLSLLLILCFLSKRRTQKAEKTPTTDPEDRDLASDDRILLFSMESLVNATNNFHDDLKLGEGGFGTVYKGTLEDGREIAVKRLSVRSLQGRQEFINEIKVVARIQHRNLINLLGCCTEGSDRILVYEYLPNNSLDKILFDSEKRRMLDWQKRCNIIFGVARGLLYLHEDCKLKIIHRDIKGSNILLDDKFNPKIADFGLARLFSDEESYIQTRIAGTYGYMAPEYAMQGQLSAKADVYSYGVLLIEIISGKKNSEYDPAMNVQSLIGCVWRLYQNGNIMEIVDESVRETLIEEQMVRFVHVGLLCTQADSSLRPTISQVLLMLSSSSVTLPLPTMPAFVDYNHSITHISNERESSGSSLENHHHHHRLNVPSPNVVISNANVSISDLTPR
eukprot:TRINITY_DN5455_c1_g1_i3.p1 TRINITY_DN5455_c1_g1~~TRINITY_DN5455_c1_g1_i3.p1  ORF type:complete len:576 (+),score=59.82 TRINITY_DN5455_c1_g1_i3:162-1730(+)